MHIYPGAPDLNTQEQAPASLVRILGCRRLAGRGAAGPSIRACISSLKLPIPPRTRESRLLIERKAEMLRSLPKGGVLTSDGEAGAC
jgi:hypothetical protein